MQIDDGRDVVFENDQEIAQFLYEKIEKFQEKIIEIENYCQLLQLFKQEFDQYRELEESGELAKIPLDQLEQVKQRLQQQSAYLSDIELIDENFEVNKEALETILNTKDNLQF